MLLIDVGVGLRFYADVYLLGEKKENFIRNRPLGHLTLWPQPSEQSEWL